MRAIAANDKLFEKNFIPPKNLKPETRD